MQKHGFGWEIHVVPHNDSRNHFVGHLGKCWCKPLVEEGVIKHNSLDRREFEEPLRASEGTA